MDLSASFSSDWLVWDNLEAVRVERTRQGSPQLDRLTAKRRSLTRKELAASGGVYTGNDCVWLIPRAQLVPGFDLAPADVIIAGPGAGDEGARYTVLEADDRKYRQTLRLVCRNLVLNAQLRDLIQIERAALSYDAAGAAVKTFPSDGGGQGQVLYANLPARVQLLTDEVADQRGLRGFVGNVAVTVGRQVAVSSEDRVVWLDVYGMAGPAGATRLLDIRGLHDPARIDQLPVLDCELRP